MVPIVLVVKMFVRMFLSHIRARNKPDAISDMSILINGCYLLVETIRK